MEINGLPLHPLVVHAAVIFGPLAGADRPRLRLRPEVALAACAGRSSRCRSSSRSRPSSPPWRGSRSSSRGPSWRPLVEDHEERGELLRNWSLSFVVDALLAAWAWAAPPRSPRAGARGVEGLSIGWVAMVLLVAGSIGLLVLVFLAGDSGAQAVWG